jgi:hypothetical protein
MYDIHGRKGELLFLYSTNIKRLGILIELIFYGGERESAFFKRHRDAYPRCLIQTLSNLADNS